MPKLNDEDYLVRHEMLHRVWGKDQRPFSRLNYQQQRDLHDYFNLSKICTDEELLAYRKLVTKKDPGLSQRAGKAFLAILRPDQSKLKPVLTGQPKSKNITIRALAKPEVDVEMLAKALLEMIEGMAPEERAKFAAEGEKILTEKKKAA
jgi:hypothetical protein